jgi:hypothetical protein
MYRSIQNNLKKMPVAGRLQNVNGKTFAAVVLLSVMVLLWGRVLLRGKSGPASADAQQASTVRQAAAQDAQPLQVLPVKLDVLPGRHDRLYKDIFSTDGWDAFALDGGAEKATVSKNSMEEKHRANLEKIAATLKLEAIIRDANGHPFQVFVNDTIFTVGSVLTVKEGPEQYELVLKEIGENEATFTWNETSIILKMTETVEK